jgi:hypothetical protein
MEMSIATKISIENHKPVFGRPVIGRQSIGTIDIPGIVYDRYNSYCMRLSEVKEYWEFLYNKGDLVRRLYFELQVQTGARGTEMTSFQLSNYVEDEYEGQKVYFVRWQPLKNQNEGYRIEQVHHRTIELLKYCYYNNLLNADGSFRFSHATYQRFCNQWYRPHLGGSFLDRQSASTNVGFPFCVAWNKSPRHFFCCVYFMIYVMEEFDASMAVSRVRTRMRHSANYITSDYYLRSKNLLKREWDSFRDVKSMVQLVSRLWFDEDFDGPLLNL